MRKQLKKKKHSCALCKPHKMAKANRWTNKERAKMLEADREMRDASRSSRGTQDL